MTDVVALLSFGVHLKTAADLLKNMLDLLDRATSASKVSRETVKVLDTQIRQLTAEILAANALALTAQADQFALSNRVRELEAELMKREDWAAEQEHYTLHAVDSGAFVYALKPGVEATEPPHWLCQQCFQQQRKSILQFHSQPPNVPGGGRGDYRRWVCSACGHALMAFYNKSPATTTKS